MAKGGERQVGGSRTSRRVWFLAFAIASVVSIVGYSSAGAATQETQATVAREAYFTYPATQITPPVIRNGFPPATACLVAGLVGVPQICGTEAQQLAALLGLSDGLPVLVTPDGDLAQPTTVPGSTPVGMLGGQPRYVSLLALNLPALEDGQRYGKFELVLHEDGVNFAIESPALRDLVLQAVAQLEEQDPKKISDSITKAITGGIPLATNTITGIEMCPITTEWNGGRAQGAALDGTRLPKVDCLTGTTGTFDTNSRTWTFDLTFAAQAWTEGVDGKEFPNQGVMLRPLGAPNLAYGDPDLSTNWIVGLADSTNTDAALRPRVRFETVSDEGGSVVDDGSIDLPPDLGLGDDTGVDFGDINTGSGSDSGSGVNTGSGSDGPKVIAAASKASTPGWLWFLLPLAVVLAYVFDQSLIATPAALRRRPGALTKLEMNREDD